MPSTLTDVDLCEFGTVLKDGDANGFATLVGALGIELELAAFLAYLHRWERTYAPVIGEALLKLAYSALREPTGFALGQWASFTLLVVRSGDRLVLAMQTSTRSKPFPKTGWKIARWYQDPTRNRPTVEAWAAHPARATDAMRIPIALAPASPPTNDSRGDALLAAVVANPEDAAARLVYGDWLVEQGDIRGELVRVQCELRTLGQRWEQRELLVARERELLRNFEPAMLAPIEPFIEYGTIKRGLVERVTIRVVKLAKYGPELVANHPITELRILVNGPEECARLATLPYLSRIPRLEFEARRTPKILYSRTSFRPSAIADSAIFAATEHLEFSDTDDTDAEWQEFLARLDAPRLRSLTLVRCKLELAGLEFLARTTTVPSLRELVINFPGFGRKGAPSAPLVTAMGKLAKRPELERFKFDCWHIGDAVVARCVTALGSSSSLVNLAFQNCTIGEATTAAIAGEGAARLESLEFVRNPSLDLAELATLLGSDQLVNLKKIYISSETTDGDELAAMTEALAAAPPKLALVHWPACGLSEAQRARVRESRELCTDYALPR